MRQVRALGRAGRADPSCTGEARQGEGGLGGGGSSDTSLIGKDGELILVGGLDAAWKEDCSGLARRLDEWRRLLRDIGDVPSDAGRGPATQKSSLETILAACQLLVSDMLSELSMMEQIEREAVAEELTWIRAMNGEDDDDDDDDADVSNEMTHRVRSRAGAIWRAL